MAQWHRNIQDIITIIDACIRAQQDEALTLRALARKLGYLATPIVGECGYSWNWYPIAHGWVEIELDGETFLFDPQIENYNLRAGISNETHSAWQVTYESAPARYLKH